MTLYQELKQAGIETGNHESDLYFPSTPESRAILGKYPIHKSNRTYFTNQRVGGSWIEVPFAFDPFWEKLGMLHINN